jgi:alkanesulfonate monooxygenase SsuD/methylene tetrahydromethanopterin reductase-like flavin-dependent oxidoreductase (luciferase family)
MRFGLHVPQLGALGEPSALVDLARRAETAGWDGFFVWDHVMHAGDPPACDPWVALGAIAAVTERMRLGPLVTPLPRRRPWKVAREAVTLDRLSNGRAVLGVGIGTDHYREFAAFAEPATNDRARAARLDEALEIVTALWSGTRVTHEGAHYRATDVVQVPGPVQLPRIPIWCAAAWPHLGPLRRAARWDGIVPVGRLSPVDVAAVATEIARLRTAGGPFDVALPSSAATGTDIAEYAKAGVTWWLASIRPSDTLAGSRALVDAGPPTELTGPDRT